MENKINQRINNLQRQYRKKMREYENKLKEHRRNLYKYYHVCAESKFKRCAGENQYCRFRGRRMVRYGANGMYRYRYMWRRWGTWCNNRTFGDPIRGVKKECHVYPHWCRTPQNVSPINIQMSKDQLNNMIDELKVINNDILKEVRKLIELRTKWKGEHQKQEEYILKNFQMLDDKRSQIEDGSLKTYKSTKGKLRDSESQVRQMKTRYAIWTGVAATTIALTAYMILKGKKEAN